MPQLSAQLANEDQLRLALVLHSKLPGRFAILLTVIPVSFHNGPKVPKQNNERFRCVAAHLTDRKQDAKVIDRP